MVLLVDTQAVVWAHTDERRLSKTARSAMYRALKRRELAISVFTIYEIGTLFRHGKLSSIDSVENIIRQFTEDYLLKPVTEEIALLATQFPLDFPRDPGDRIIAATARVEGIPLVTADRHIQASKLIKTIW